MRTTVQQKIREIEQILSGDDMDALADANDFIRNFSTSTTGLQGFDHPLNDEIQAVTQLVHKVISRQSELASAQAEVEAKSNTRYALLQNPSDTLEQVQEKITSIRENLYGKENQNRSKDQEQHLIDHMLALVDQRMRLEAEADQDEKQGKFRSDTTNIGFDGYYDAEAAEQRRFNEYKLSRNIEHLEQEKARAREADAQLFADYQADVLRKAEEAKEQKLADIQTRREAAMQEFDAEAQALKASNE